MGYVNGCDFRMGLKLCQREIPIIEVKRMFAEGRTIWLDGFISKGGKPFGARLVMKDGAVGFDFTR